MKKPHISGWCSPWCSPKSHATCQERIEKGQNPNGCDCPKHPANMPITDRDDAA